VQLSDFSPKEVPFILLPYQQRWLSDRSPFKLWTKSRRIGASWAEAADSTLIAASERGSDVFYSSYDKEMTRQFILDSADWARLYGSCASEIEEDRISILQEDEQKSIQVFRIWFNSGHRIEAISSNPRNIRSKQGRIVCDEAAWVDDLKAVLKAAKVMRLWGDTVVLISTYNGTNNDYYDLEQEVLSGKLPYSRHLTTFRQAVAEGLYKRICLINGLKYSKENERDWIEQTYLEVGDDSAEELDCVPRSGGDTYLPRSLVESCCKRDSSKVLEWVQSDQFALLSDSARTAQCRQWLESEVLPLISTFDPELPSYYGSDFGRSQDLSVIVFGQKLSNLVRKVRLVLELRNIPFKQQWEILRFLVEKLPKFTNAAMDSRGNGQQISEYAWQKWGKQRVQAVMLSSSFYEENFPKYKAALQEGLLELPASANLVEDHRLVEVISGVPKIAQNRRNKDNKGRSRHGDSAIACLLFWYAASSAESFVFSYKGIKSQTAISLGFSSARKIRGF